MATLNPEIVSLIGISAGVIAVCFAIILFFAMLARNLKFFGYDGLDKNDYPNQE